MALNLGARPGRGWLMRSKPFSLDQCQEFETRTADLSLSAKGAWITLRMRLSVVKQAQLSMDLAKWARLLRCRTDQAASVIGELSASCTAGYRVEKPPGTEDVRIVYEPDEKRALFLNSESLRVSKLREDRNKKERKRMPENWNLSAAMQDFASKYGMSTATMEHEFVHCKTHHAEALFTDRGWESQVWHTWVLNWVKFGRKQVVNGHGSADRPPPPPPKNDPIARGAWGRAYGDPKKWGYE